MALELCYVAMFIILERQGQDQLSRWGIHPIVKDHLKAVPKTNTISERELDYLIRVKQQQKQLYEAAAKRENLK